MLTVGNWKTEVEGCLLVLGPAQGSNVQVELSMTGIFCEDL